MRREQDSQKSKLYAAEREVFKRTDGVSDARRNARKSRSELWAEHPEYMTLDECAAYVRKVTSSPWFRKKYGDYYVTVREGRGGGHSWGGRNGYMTLGRYARRPWYVLHELTHNIITATHGGRVASHGWQFAATELELIRHFIGVEKHDQLKAAFRERKVRFRPKRKGQPLTPEQREAAVARLAKAREAKAAKAAAGATVRDVRPGSIRAPRDVRPKRVEEGCPAIEELMRF